MSRDPDHGLVAGESRTRRFAVGETVTWLWHPRGGYGYTVPVRARVIADDGGRVHIAAERKDGGETERRVRRENLRPVRR